MGKKSKQAGFEEVEAETSENAVKKPQKNANDSDEEPDTSKAKTSGKKSKKAKGGDFWDTSAGDEENKPAEEEEDNGKKFKKDAAPTKKAENGKANKNDNGSKVAKKGADDDDEEPKQPAAKGKKGKKKGGDDYFDGLDLEAPQEDDEKPAPQKPPKEEPQTSKKSLKKTGEETQKEETKPAKAKKEDAKPTGKKGGKKAGDDYFDSLADDSETAAVEEKKETKAAAKPVKSEQPEKTTTSAQEDKAETSEQPSDTASKKKKKKAAGAAEPEKPAPKADAKVDPKDAKAAKGEKRRQQMAELLRAQREELEKKEREAEERRKQKEEEDRLQAEEDAREAEEERIQREHRKAKKKENAAAAAKRAEEQKKADKLARLAAAGMLPPAMKTDGEGDAATSEGQAADQPKKKVVYASKKKPQKAKEAKPEEGSAAPAAPAPVSVPDQKASTPAVVEPVQIELAPAAPASWDDEDEVKPVVTAVQSNWDDEDEEPAKPSAPAPVPASAKPAPATTVTTTTTTTTTTQKAEPTSAPAKEKTSKKEKPPKGKVAKIKNETEKSDEPEEKELRSPICCILGHVDTGKTSLLDKIRNTDVQKGEAGGITQQIGATYFPMNTLQDATRTLREKFKLDVLVPGLLIIDTPGHESFSNLRSRGSGLCDIAILVVDIMHLLEPQTIESIKLLQMRKTPYVVALNKVDRLYGWRGIPWNPFRDSLRAQTRDVALEFDKRVKEVIAAFAGEVETNAVLYYDNKDYNNYVSLVPTSAHTGEGIPDLLLLLVQLTQKRMTDRLYYSPTVQCTVLEVKVTEGLGTTIDVILVNGCLRVGDTIVLSGMNGSISTQVRALKTPQPLKELRVKSNYVDHDEIKAAMGLKIVASDLDKAVAGSALLVAKTPEEVETLKKEVQSDMDSILNSVDSSARGVSVQASTLGSLEALLTFLKASKIAVSGVNIGPIHKKDIIRASVMLEHNKEFACILAFDVKVEKEAQLLADELGVRIFTADIIYHLFGKFTEYIEELKRKKREEMGALAVWPCILKIKPDCVFMKSNPILLGVEVLEGVLKINTPIITDKFVSMGVVTTIEHNHKAKQEVKKGEEAAIKLEWSGDHAPVYQRHFEIADTLMSKLSRQSIDVLKDLYEEQITSDLKKLIKKLKKTLKVE